MTRDLHRPNILIYCLKRRPLPPSMLHTSILRFSAIIAYNENERCKMGCSPEDTRGFIAIQAIRLEKHGAAKIQQSESLAQGS
ncbi:hypothetical protein F4680DRAFT_430387 [Xylaria scruposa]|nr:hypothetical protein F4680DRAFT_430387 [Xylaria scruposa]